MKNKILWILFPLIILLNRSSIAQPTAHCQDSIVVFFNAFAQCVIHPSFLNNNSFSPVGIQSFALDSTIFPEPPGDHYVTLTVTDNLGATNTCTTKVKVRYALDPPPVANCKNIDLYLDEDGKATITSADIDDGSFSLSGIQFTEISKSDFTCDDIGIIPDTLKLTDIGFATSFCIAAVTVIDTVKPEVHVKDILVELDQSGTVFITPDLLDDGSTDACGIQQMQLDTPFFDCTDLGEHRIILTVTDFSGNSDTSSAIVIIKDFTPPKAYCRNITKILNSNGSTTVTPAELNDNSFDACGISLIKINKTDFYCNNGGINEVIMTVKDVNGNIAGCVATVTIENLLGPNALAKNISIDLDETGHAYITPEDIDNGSNDICPLTRFEISESSFDHTDVGNNDVVLTVRNIYDAYDTAIAHVTVNQPANCQTATVYNMSNSPSFVTNDFRFVEIDEQKNVWAGTSGSGLFMYNGNNWVVPNNQFGMQGFIVRSMRRNPVNGDIWVGMSKSSPCLGYLGGIYAYSNQNNYSRFLPPIVAPTINESSTFYELYAYALINFGIELPNGSNYWSFLYLYNSQLQSLVVRSLDFNRKTLRNWAGCTPQICQPGYNGGVSFIQNGSYNSINAGLPGYSNLDMFITSITSDPTNGDVYVAIGRSCNFNSVCTPPTISLYDSSGTYLTSFAGTPSTFLPASVTPNSNTIRAIYMDTQNRLWVGGELNGIAVHEGGQSGQWHFINNTVTGYQNNAFINFDAISEGPDGSVYFGTSDGILKYDGGIVTNPSSWKRICINGTLTHNVGSIRFDDKKNMWVSTRNGIYKIPYPGGVVKNVYVNVYAGAMVKKPFQGVVVQAMEGNTNVGSPVTTDADGIFQGPLDAQLALGVTYKLKFTYNKIPTDNFDGNFEYEISAYTKGSQIDDVFMPVKLMKQTREVLSKISPQTPLPPLKYDLKIFDFPFNEDFMVRRTHQVASIQSALITLSQLNEQNATVRIDNLARGYLALYAHNELTQNAYELYKNPPKTLLSLVNLAIDLFAAKKAIKDKKEGKTIEVEKTEEQKNTAAINKAVSELFDVLNFTLDKINEQIKDQTIKSDIELIKKAISFSQPLIITTMKGFNDPDEVFKAMLDKVKEIITNAVFVGMYETYVYGTQSYIDKIPLGMLSNTTNGTFGMASENIRGIISEMSDYTTNVNNRIDLTLANSEVKGSYKAGLEADYELANLNFWNGFKKHALNQVNTLGAKFLEIKNPLILIARAIWQGGNTVIAVEESVRGCITVGLNQADITDEAFNPTPVSTIAAHPSMTMNNSQLNVGNELTDYNIKVDSIVALIQNNQNNAARIKISELFILDSLIDKKVNNLSKRYVAIADSAVDAIPSFNDYYRNLINDIIRIKTARAYFDFKLADWFADTTNLANTDTLESLGDSLKGANNNFTNSVQAIDGITQGFDVLVRVMITGINAKQEVVNGSTNSLSVSYENLGIQTASDVYLTLQTSSGFNASLDSFHIGSLAPGDSGNFTFQITAPSVDSAGVFLLELHASNGEGDFESHLMTSSHVCMNIYYSDFDKDGFGNVNSTIIGCTQPAGFVTDTTDCNDTLSSIHPGAAERCNGIDDNCNGQIDEGVQLTFYEDEDGDGFGNSIHTIQSCSMPHGYVSNNTDCNDTLSNIHPNAIEICNGVDENCNVQIDEGSFITFYKDNDGDGYGNLAITTQACFLPVGYINDSADCNDTRADVHPGTIELCNGFDDNCDGHIDDGCGGNTYFEDFDTDGFGNLNRTITTNAGSPPSGYVINNTDCNDHNLNIHPGVSEICNGIDDNCNATTDEGVQLTFYRDHDGDGYGNPLITNLSCTAGIGYVSNDDDCNDNNSSIHPGVTEIVCNGVDENCNIVTDEGILPVFYADADHDGYGNPASTTNACIAPVGFVADSTDCNDSNASIKPGASEICNGVDENCNVLIDEGVQTRYYLDADLDGFGTVTGTTQACSAPNGFVSDSSDCNDSNPFIHPGVSEICNGIDENCNGTSDEGVTILFFGDLDGDGFGSDVTTLYGCSAPNGFVSNNDDCDDANISIHPGAAETCNQVDDNCDGQIDENVKTVFYRDADADGYGNILVTTEACIVPTGFVSNHDDCNDNNGQINPPATESCNYIDDNCNTLIDDGVLTTYYRDADEDGYGNPAITIDECSTPPGYVLDNHDCNDGSASANPAFSEICNGVDDNCDGAIDEGVKTLFFKDNDGDGYGNVNINHLSCTQPVGFVPDSTDCNDLNSLVHVGAPEICNGIDDDCDGLIDEDCPTVTLNLKVYIEGYYLGGGAMRAAVDPVAFPSLCDTMTVELRNASSPYQPLYSQKSTIDINGNGTFVFPVSAMGDEFYVVVHHRNAIETWSANPVLINSLTSYDFTNAPTNTYGSNVSNTLDNTGWAMYSGDCSSAISGIGFQDGVVESQDYSDLENAVNIVLIGYVFEDITGDGIVESADYSLMENNVYYIIFSVHP